MPRFVVEVRDSALSRIGVIEHYTELNVISRYRAVGSWSLTLPAGAGEARLLQPGGGIIIWADGLHDRPILSGPLTSVHHQWSADQPGGQILFTGVSDEQLLWHRVTLPVPDAPIDEQTQDRLVYSAPAARALAYLVDVQAGPNARPDRVIPHLEVPTPTGGRRVEVSTRFDVLGTVLQEVAASAGIGWRLRQNLADRLVFETFAPRDLSTTAVFAAEDGNLAGWDYSLTAPSATRFFVAAQGEGQYRWISQYDDGVARTYNSTDPRVEYTGSGWTYEPGRGFGDYFNDVHYTTEPDDEVRFTFRGTGVKFITERSPDMGSVDIYLDGSYMETVSLYSPVSYHRVVGWQRQDLPYGDHVLKLVHIGPNRLVVDAFEVTGLPSVAHEWYRHPIEMFIDRRDIPIALGFDGSPINPSDGSPADPKSLTQLDQAADEAMAEAAATAKLAITPIDTPDLQYGRDYEVGDVVTVRVGDEKITDVLREVHLRDGSDGPSIAPVIGSDQATETPTLYREVRRLWNSIKRLEARR